MCVCVCVCARARAFLFKFSPTGKRIQGEKNSGLQIESNRKKTNREKPMEEPKSLSPHSGREITPDTSFSSKMLSLLWAALYFVFASASAQIGCELLEGRCLSVLLIAVSPQCLAQCLAQRRLQPTTADE